MANPGEVAICEDAVALFGCSNYENCKNFVPNNGSGYYQMCHEGHVICPPCWDRAAPKCPTANCSSNDRLQKREKPMREVRLPLYDAIWEGTTFMCPFHGKGCEFYGSYKTLEVHAEVECEFRDTYVQCIFDACEKKNIMPDNYTNHLVGVHHIRRINGPIGRIGIRFYSELAETSSSGMRNERSDEPAVNWFFGSNVSCIFQCEDKDFYLRVDKRQVQKDDVILNLCTIWMATIYPSAPYTSVLSYRTEGTSVSVKLDVLPFHLSWEQVLETRNRMCNTLDAMQRLATYTPLNCPQEKDTERWFYLPLDVKIEKVKVEEQLYDDTPIAGIAIDSTQLPVVRGPELDDDSEIVARPCPEVYQNENPEVVAEGQDQRVVADPCSEESSPPLLELSVAAEPSTSTAGMQRKPLVSKVAETRSEPHPAIVTLRTNPEEAILLADETTGVSEVRSLKSNATLHSGGTREEEEGEMKYPEDLEQVNQRIQNILKIDYDTNNCKDAALDEYRRVGDTEQEILTNIGAIGDNCVNETSGKQGIESETSSSETEEEEFNEAVDIKDDKSNRGKSEEVFVHSEDRSQKNASDFETTIDPADFMDCESTLDESGMVPRDEKDDEGLDEDDKRIRKRRENCVIA